MSRFKVRPEQEILEKLHRVRFAREKHAMDGSQAGAVVSVFELGYLHALMWVLGDKGCKLL